MPHVFVETNWLPDYAAPAHHKVPDAVRLLERGQRGEFILHIPNVSFMEASQSIHMKCQMKCQPVDGPGILGWPTIRRGSSLPDGAGLRVHRIPKGAGSQGMGCSVDEVAFILGK